MKEGDRLYAIEIMVRGRANTGKKAIMMMIAKYFNSKGVFTVFTNPDQKIKSVRDKFREDYDSFDPDDPKIDLKTIQIDVCEENVHDIYARRGIDIPLYFDAPGTDHRVELEHFCRAIMRGEYSESLQRGVRARFHNTEKGTKENGQN